jgi:hypothetical protein
MRLYWWSAYNPYERGLRDLVIWDQKDQVADLSERCQQQNGHDGVP